MDKSRHNWSYLAILLCIGVGLFFPTRDAEAKSKNLALGNIHTCAISTAGKVMCWGDNTYGQLGNGTTTAVTPYNFVAAKLDPTKDIPVAITAGGKHTCSLLKTGLIKCWGDNSAGQLGTGKITPVESTPVSVVTINNVKAVVAGLKHSCALLGTGKVMCWGDNTYGQLGNGDNKPSALPVEIKNIGAGIPTDIALGNWHTCVLIKGVGIKCWGKNDFGQLGNNSNINSPTPVLAKTLATSGAIGATSIDSNGDYTCAIMWDKTVQCWGWNGRSQQGPKQYSASNPSPVIVPGLKNVGTLALGFAHACSTDLTMASKPKLLCLGANSHAELGLGYATPYDIDKPTPISITDPIVDVAAGGGHTCANTTIGGVALLKCWGDDSFGQLGMDPQSTYLKKDPNNPNSKFSLTPIGITTFTASSTATALDANPAPPVPAPPSAPPPPPPPPVACTYTYTDWSTCTLQSWGWAQGRIATSKSPAICTGDPVVSQPCTPPPLPTCPSGLNWDAATQKCACPSGKLDWNYWYNGQPHQECGCITVNADVDPVTKKPIPWIGDTFVMVYFSGGVPTVDWAYKTDNLSIFQGPWYYAAKDGSVNGIPNGFSTSAAITPLTGYTMLADNQLWAARQPKKVYVSGGKLGSTWKNCSASDIAGGGIPAGGSGTPPPGTGTGTLPANATLDQAWAIHKPVIAGLMNDLVKTTMELAAAQAKLQDDAWATFNTSSEYMLETYSEKKVITLPPAGTKIIPSKAAADAALQKQKDAFSKLNAVMVSLMKLDPSTTDAKIVDPKTRDILVQVAMAYLNALLTISVNGPLTNPLVPNCNDDPIQNQHIYKGYDPAIFNGMVQCLSVPDVANLDHSLITAFYITKQIVQFTHPNYATAIQDRMLSILVPYVISLNEIMRHRGGEDPSVIFMKLVADRFKMVPDTAKLTTDTNVQLEPDGFVLYNPATQKAAGINLCSAGNIQKIMDPKQNPPPPAGTLAAWNDKYNCMVFKNFVKAATDPAMNTSLTCFFWDSARLGKPCPPPLKTSWLDSLQNEVTAIASSLGNPLLSTAYADTVEFEICPAGMTPNICGKCVPISDSPPPNGEKPTKCQMLCGDCMLPIADPTCLVALSCPYDGSKKSYCQNDVKIGDITCKGGPSDCITVEKVSQPGLVACTECSACVWNATVVSCKAQVKNCLDECGKNNKIVCACGNWTLDPGEQCDDGNLKSGDGCSSSCQLEKTAVCGNNVPEAGEGCDDGNTKDGDGCSSTCKQEKSVCGNITLEAGEGCDDGNTKDGDGCSSTCQIEKTVCGNGKVEKGEACDGGPGCDASCQWCTPCDPGKLVECAAAKDIFKKALQGTVSLDKDIYVGIDGKPAPVDASGKTVMQDKDGNHMRLLCKKGMPISCEYPLFRKPCEDAKQTCQTQNTCGDDPNLKAMKDEVCPAASASAEAMNVIKANLPDSLATFLETSENMDAFRHSSVNVLLSLYPAVTQWLEYYSGEKYSDARKAEVLSDAVWTLWHAELMTDPEVMKKASASTDKDSSSKSGYIITIDPGDLVGMTKTTASIAGAHEAIHVITEKLIGKDGPADKTLEKAVADASRKDSIWFEDMKAAEGFTAHWVMDELKNSLGSDWMVTKGVEGQTKAKLCQGYTP